MKAIGKGKLVITLAVAFACGIGIIAPHFVAADAINNTDFVTTWKTDNAGTTSSTSIGIPLAPSTVYNFQIDWNNDGVYDQTYNATTPASPATFVTHDYGVAGTYKVRIGGTFPRIYFANAGDKLKLLSVDQWGTISWRSMNSAFWGCANLRIPAVDAPNLSLAVDFSQIFNGAASLNDPMNHWNVSTINNMTSAFSGASSFNQPLNNWNVGNVANMAQMFSAATAFNQDLTSWNTGNVTTMLNMFVNATNFNNGQASGASTAPLTWNTSKVTSMQAMFQNAKAFNQPIGSWDVSKVTVMSSMFFGASVFNQPLASWNVGAVTTMINMFRSATVFNQPIGSWNTVNVTNMSGMFADAIAFNNGQASGASTAPLLWDTGKVTDMSSMFYSATTNAFNQPVGSWNTSNVTMMQGMFQNAQLFNQPVSSWNTGKVTNMSYMFFNARAFDQPIGTWNTGLVTTMRYMFASAVLFNQDIGAWNTANVTDTSYMFLNAVKFNQAIGTWNTVKVTTMASMFDGATVFNNGLAAGISGPMPWNTGLVTNMSYMFNNAKAFNQDISTWNVSNVTTMQRMLSYLPYFNQPIGVWNTAKLLDINNMLHTSTSFNQPLGNWNVTGVANATNFLVNVKLSIVNYDNLLINWNSQAVKTSVIFHGGLSQYCAGAAARTNLITVKTWTFTADGGQNCAPTDIGLTNATVSENTTLVGTLSSVDPDAGNTFTYSLVAGTGDEDNTKFSINNTTKTLSFASAPNFENPTDLGDIAGNNTYSIRIRSTDNLGGTYDEVFVITVTNIDEAAPVITIAAPTKLDNVTITDTTIRVVDETAVNAASVVIAPTGSTAGTSSFSCTQTSVTQVDCTVSVTSSGDLNIQATDVAGNVATKKETNYVIDTTPPAFASSSVDVITHGVNQPIVSFSATDNISVDHYEITYTADNGGAGVSGSTTTISPATSPVTLTLDPDEAVHTVTIRVYDTAGNYADRVIKFPPIVNFTAPTTLSNTTITNATITVTSPGGNDLTGITFSAGSTGATLGTCTGAGGDTSDPYANPVTCVINNVASTGSVTVNATDSVTGAVGQNSQSFIIDTTAPTVAISAPTKLDNGSITDTTITITDNVGIVVADVAIGVGSTASISNLNCTQTSATRVDCTVHVNSSGSLVIEVSDKAGNTASATELGYVIDTTSPVVAVGNLPAITLANQSAYLVSGTCTVGDGNVSVVVNGVTHTVSCSAGAWSLTLDMSSLSDGSPALTVTASQTDAAGNTGSAGAQTAPKDTVAPTVGINTVASNSGSPALSGSVSDPAAVVKVTVNGTEYTATNNGDSTWSLPAGTIAPALADGVYGIVVTGTDSVGNSSLDGTTDELSIDTTAPTGTLTPIAPSITNSPALSGTVSDPAAVIKVTVNGTEYTATNNGDGTWSLPAGTIAPALNPGTYDVIVLFIDVLGNTSNDTTTNELVIQRSDADPPTVNPLTAAGGQPIITGTYDAENSQSLSVAVNGITYVLGVATQLTVSGNTWKLDLSSLSPALPAGAYDVKVAVTTRGGAVLGDSTATELVLNDVSKPLATTGISVIVPTILGAMLITASALLICRSKQSSKK
ncbi:MAG: BspA family leucine-rich repeat surface protein [Candidatus Saccharimonadales bacterium]